MAPTALEKSPEILTGREEIGTAARLKNDFRGPV